MKPTFVSIVLCVGWIASCRVGQEHEVPATHAPAAWAEAPEVVAPGPVDERWWSAFGDPTLDALVARAWNGSFDLKIAGARVREARALVAATRGRWDPQVDANGGYTRSDVGTNAGGSGDGHDTFQAGFDARWELDAFGARDRAIEAAEAEVDVAHEDRRDAVVRLTGEVARTYLELRGLQRELAITRDNWNAQRETLRLTRVRFGAGLTTDLDVARTEALASSTEAEIPALEARVRAHLHALSVLVGEAPGAVARELETPAALPEPPATVATGVPSELLRRRADIRRAERELARAAALSGEAVAALYPRFALGASLGQQSDRVRTLLDADSNFLSFGASFTAPIFSGGTLRAQADAADARVEQARYAYQRTVIAAWGEVETALSSVARARQRRDTLATAVEADRRSVKLATDLFERGLASFFEVLDAQQSLLRSESALAASATELATGTVALYKSLGGGWETAE